MTTIIIDGVEYQANPDHNLLQAMLSLGLDLPYFCWHPALGSVGSCRQCAVSQYADENDTRGRVIVACMTPVQEGMRIGLQDAQSQDFRAGVIEALMSNHPHDCPVCEEGGECHLQDMTLMSGHTARRYRGLKRSHRNQDLGPCINHEMNRCIACYRCVRFYRDYAGGDDLSAQGAHNHVYFGRERDGTLESAFSGNLVEVCPTGVFTDKTYSAHFARKWDQQCAPSVCAHCAVGCNTTPAERYGRILRISNRYHHQLNGYFLCDRGRFGYEYSNVEQRLRGGLRHVDGRAEPVAAELLLDELLERLADPEQAVFALGSPRASLEDNFALKTLVGDERFYAGVAAPEWACLQRYRGLAARDGGLATLDQIESADAALILGEDIASTAPRVALALRQLLRNRGLERAAELGVPPWQDGAVRSIGQWYRSPLRQLLCQRNELSEHSDGDVYAAPATLARLGHAVALVIDPDAPAVDGLDAEQQAWVTAAAEMLLAAERPLLVSGCALGEPELLAALANIDRALHRVGRAPRLYVAAPECNSIGLLALAQHGLDALQSDMEQAVAAGKRCSLVVLENDLLRRLSPDAFQALRKAAGHWLVLDCLATATSEHADAVVAVPSLFEKQGSLVNASAMAQRLFAVHPGADGLGAWQQLAAAAARRLAAGAELPEHWQSLAGWRLSDDVRAAMAAADEGFTWLDSSAPDACYRERGVKLPRQSHRYSGRTAMAADVAVSERPPPQDADSPFSFSMEGSPQQGGDSRWRASLWAPGWNSNQALHKFQQEVGGDWRGAEPPVLLRFAGAAISDYLSPAQATESRAPTAGTQWQLLPRHEVFGSEELSNWAPAIGARTAPLRLAIDAASARQLQLRDWSSVELHYNGHSQTLYVAVDPSLPPQCAALPVQRAALWLPLDGSARVELRAAERPLPRPTELIAREGAVHYNNGGSHD